MSVVLLAIQDRPSSAHLAAIWNVSAIFAVSDNVRSDAVFVVKALQSRGIDVWMISGDNATTARAVAGKVGILESNVIAGVLPDQKSAQIERLQWMASNE